MKTELEQEFFRVFGIATQHLLNVNTNQFVDVYPEITDRKLLEIICILGTAIRHFKIPPKLKLEQLKYHILRNCINEQEGIYTRIQQLFKEEE